MGEKELIGRGYIRDVYLVEWEGRKLVVKFLREDYEARASEIRVEKIHRWEAAALDAVRNSKKSKKTPAGIRRDRESVSVNEADRPVHFRLDYRSLLLWR